MQTVPYTEHERLLAAWLDAANRERWHLCEYHKAKEDNDAAWARLRAHRDAEAARKAEDG